MKRLTLLLLLAVSLPISAHADDASRHAKAAEMVSLLHMDRVMGQMMDNMMKQTSAMTQQMAGANMTPAQAARITDFQRQMFGLIDSKIGWKTLEPDYIDLYARNFTDTELDGIIAFYKSPAGVAFVDKTPTITNEGMQLVQTRMVAIQPQLKQMIDDFAKSAAAPASGTSSPK